MTMWPNQSLQSIPTNHIGTFSGLDGIQPAGLELRKFSRASAFGISRLRRDSRHLIPRARALDVRRRGAVAKAKRIQIFDE
jgi:hypothetical protein